MSRTTNHKFYIALDKSTMSDGTVVEPQLCIAYPSETPMGEPISRHEARERLGRELTELLEWWRRG